jgi:homoserine O-acetyltransferase
MSGKQSSIGAAVLSICCTAAFALLAPLLADAQAPPQQAAAAPSWGAVQEGDFIARDFRFQDGEMLSELRLHYATLGAPVRDAQGRVSNAVLVLHGTGGSGRQFLSEQFAGVLFAPGELLDARRYFIILPDNIGHGHSSKPSDGLRAQFPHYAYADMVRAQHLLLTNGLGVNHLRLLMGTSMGCMHSWMWGEAYPEFADALLPLACLPVEIAGRNRMTRKMMMDSIRTDPSWKNGDYASEPEGLRAALYILLILTSSPAQMQKEFPSRAAADKFLDDWIEKRLAATDANDFLYQVDASRDYDPAPNLDKIQSQVLAINSADDFVNPPELRITEDEIKRVKNGRFVLLPLTDQTRGHGTHSLPAVWKQYLAELLASSQR